MIQSMHHTGIAVSDRAKLATFYQEALGFTPIGEITREGQGIDQVVGYHDVLLRGVTMSTGGGHVLELLEYEKPAPHARSTTERNVIGATHVAFEVQEIEATIARLRDLGARTMNPPGRLAPGREASYLQDPDGNWLELFEVTH